MVFSLKNISEQPLNISADELTERFVRGDVSRTTEGSGLGLSIAQNLTTLQKGKFEIYLDGDLFRVTLTFPRVKADSSEKTEEAVSQKMVRIRRLSWMPGKRMRTDGISVDRRDVLLMGETNYL